MSQTMFAVYSLYKGDADEFKFFDSYKKATKYFALLAENLGFDAKSIKDEVGDKSNIVSSVDKKGHSIKLYTDLTLEDLDNAVYLKTSSYNLG